MTTQPNPPQLAFEIDSAGAANTIYVTDTASVNDVTLKVSGNVAATFTPAPEVVDKPQASGTTGSLLYLDLTPLNLTAAEFAAIAPATEGWKFATFAGDHLVGMTPTSDVTLDPNSTITLTIGALADADATGSSASLTVTAFRVGGITLGNLPFPTNLSVSLATPPHAGEDLKQDLMVSLATPEVVNSVPGYDPVSNQLSFAFYAGPRGRPVTPTAGAQFSLSFVYASDPSGYGALCTTDEVKPPFAVVAGVNAGSWKITAHRAQESPSWTLTPPTTGPVVGIGPRATVGILANDLVTTFQPGPTVALISYSGFEGYADGVFTLPIEKYAHVRIDSLTVTPNPAVLGDGGSVDVKVSWEVENAGTMTLAPFDVDVTGETSYYPATITNDTPISLTADGTVLSSAGNIALRNVTARILPVINSFDASPRAIYGPDLPREVDLSWNVNTNENLQLVSSTGGTGPDTYSHIGEVSRKIDGPQMLTLVPEGQSGGPTVERSIVLSAFTPQASSWPVNARYLAAPPNASFIVASNGDALTAVDTMIYKPVSGTIPTGSGPAGMAFSADGSTLYVANSGDGTVSALSVESTGSVPQYSFSAGTPVTVGGAPQQIVLSPDGAYVYVTVDSGASNGLLVVLSTGETPEVVSKVPVGVAPRGVAVMGSGARIYVANSGSSTLTVVGRAPNGHHSAVDTISNVSSAQDVAVTLDDNVLLVTCPPLNSVVALNATYPHGARQTLAVGSSPQQIALMPSGVYAIVTNQGGDGVSLLSAGPTPSACTVVEADIEVGASPGAVAVTPDAGLVLVGTGGGTGLAVLTLAEYETGQVPPGIGKQPTDVTAAPDGKQAVAWHDARKYDWPGSPSTGLFVYDVKSESVTPQLATTEVVDVVFHPVASEAAAFLVDKTHASVSVLDTGDWSVSNTIDVSGQTKGLPVELATSADGSALFVLTLDSDLNCELVIYGLEGSPPAYQPKGTVPVLTTKAGSGLTLSAAPDGTKAYVVDEGTGSLFVAASASGGSWALSGEPVAVGTYPAASALSPDGTRLYVASSGTTNGSLVSVDTATSAVTSVVLPSSSLTSLGGLAVSPDGTRLFATDQIAAGIRVFDAASLRLVQTISWASGVEEPSGIAVTPDASLVLTANTNSANLGVLAQVQGGASTPHLEAGADDDLGNGSSYVGLFIRDYVGQTPSSGDPSGAWTDCPDIWPSGQQQLTDPQTTLVGGYGTDSPNTIYTSGAGVNNYIYVRGLNATSGANTSRVWLYYVNGGGQASLLLWPPSWLNSGMTALQSGLGYVPVSSTNPNEIDYTYPPFVWDAVPVDGHYCIVAWVENPPLSQPATDPRQSIGSIGCYSQLGQFVMNHPNMGWKNTQDVPTPTGETWEESLQLVGPPSRPGLFKVGLQFTKMPTDASFAFSIAGPTPGPPASVNVPKTQITSPDQTYLVPIDWTGAPPSYTTNVIVTYYAGETPIPQGGNIQVAVAANVTSMVGLVADPLAGSIRANVYPTGLEEDGFQEEWLTIVGMAQINLLNPS